jgi:hypothetical protein
MDALIDMSEGPSKQTKRIGRLAQSRKKKNATFWIYMPCIFLMLSTNELKGHISRTLSIIRDVQ